MSGAAEIRTVEDALGYLTLLSVRSGDAAFVAAVELLRGERSGRLERRRSYMREYMRRRRSG